MLFKTVTLFSWVPCSVTLRQRPFGPGIYGIYWDAADLGKFLSGSRTQVTFPLGWKLWPLVARSLSGSWMCFFASLIELLWDVGKGGTIQEQIALINIVFIVQSIKVISLDATLPLWRQKYCVSASLSLEEAGGPWGRQWVIVSGMHIYLFMDVYTYIGVPGGARGKEPSCQWRRCKRCRFNPWVGKIPWRRAWQPTPLFLPGESHG